VASVVAAVFFIWGIIIHNYWAIAIPVIIACLGVLGVASWIGWTMAATEEVIPSEQTTSATAEGSSNLQDSEAQ
jgi:hypothetical protein